MKCVIVFFVLLATANSLPRYVVPCSESLAVRSLRFAVAEVGTVEATGNNDGVRVEFYLRHVGLGKGNAYCAAFVVTALDETRVCERLPIKRTAMAYGIFLDARSRGVLSGKPQVGDIIVWKYSNRPNGHVGRIDSIGRAGNIVTVEANTSPTSAGSQRDGGGVYLKHRNTKHPLGRMMLAGLIGLGK